MYAESETLSQAHQGRPKLPPPSYGDPNKCKSEELLRWVNSGLLYAHPYRIRRQATWRKSELYTQGIQWIQPSYNSDPTRTPHWSELEFRRNDPDGIPTPVYNEILAPVENEASRLGRPEYKPYVRPRGEAPDIKARTGAKVAKAALTQALENMRWNDEEHRGNLHMPLYGGWYIKSWFDYSHEKTVPVPSRTSQACPQCGFKVASPEIPLERAAELQTQHPAAVTMEPPPKAPHDHAQTLAPSYTLHACLMCEDHQVGEEPEVDELGMPMLDELGAPRTTPIMEPGPPELEPHTPVDDELFESDLFGRPFAERVPLGEWTLKTYSPYDVFVSNLGIDQTRITEWWEAHVESIDWVCNRYDNGYLVEPEKAEVLQQYHPIAGEKAIYYGGGVSGGLFRNHVRVKEYHREPWREVERDPEGRPTGRMRMNKGRSLIMAGRTVLFDGDFMMESLNNPGTFIPRVKLDYAPWAIRSGGRELDGMALTELAFDPQDNINEMRSQIQDCRQSKGSPKWLVTRGMNFQYDAGAEAGAMWVWDPDERFRELKPVSIDNELMNPGVYTEMERDVEYMGRATNLNEVERGDVPPGVTAALALQLLAEQSGERRRPRIRRIREMLQRVYSHGLLLMHELVREPRLYWERDDSFEWRERAWTGLDFNGQTDVRIDAEPDHDTAVIQEQKLRDFLQSNPRILEDPRKARLVAQKTGVDQELFEHENLQDDAAQREFSDYREIQRPPVVDTDLDAHDVHYERHGIDCHGEFWRDLEVAAGWDDALGYLDDWEQVFMDRPVPTPTGMTQMMPGLDSQLKEQGIMSLELRIEAAWGMLLQQRGFVAGDGQQALQQVLRFRAHMAAHKMLAQGQKQAAAGGAQVLAAPEGTQTAAGTVPTTPMPESAPAQAAPMQQ